MGLKTSCTRSRDRERRVGDTFLGASKLAARGGERGREREGDGVLVWSV